MALYSVHIGTIQRSKGENAVATAAYNARDKLSLQIKDKATNITTEITWDYRSKGGLAYSRIYAQEDAPSWVYDREKLWNEVEKCENRCDAQIARKGVIALPKELTEEQNIAMLEEIFAEEIKRGMVVDLNIHNDKEDNPHAHPLVTMRELVKNRYGEYEFSRIKDRYMQSRQYVRDKRELVANIMNKHLALHGHDARVSHLSYKKQGVDLLPTIHEGPARNIKQSELVAANIEIARENARRIEERPGIILDKLVINSPVFTKEDVAKELEARLSAAINWEQIENAEEVQAELSERFTVLYEQVMNGPEIELVIESDLKDRTLYTTTKRLKLEERFEENVRGLASRNTHGLKLTDDDLDAKSFTERASDKIKDVSKVVIETINENTPLELEKPKGNIKLSEEQRKAVLGLVNGADISMLEGLPGAGKTTVMREVVRQCRKKGYTVIGIATSSSAAMELQKATGIECKNASLWRRAWQEERGRKFELNLRGDYYNEEQYQNSDIENGSNKSYWGKQELLTDKHIVLLDEASMVELASMDYLVSEVRAAGAKMIAIGDNNQLSAVGYQGAALKISELVGSEKLQDTRRQQNPEHREATKLLAQYQIRSALDIYWEDGSIKVVANEAEANGACVDAFVKRYIRKAQISGRDDLVAQRDAAILVYKNDTRRLLNNQVREQLQEAGILKGDEYNLCVGALRKNKGDVKGQKDAPAQLSYRRALEKVVGSFNKSLGNAAEITLEQREDIAYDLCRYEYKELPERLARSIYHRNFSKLSRQERKSIELSLKMDVNEGGEGSEGSKSRENSEVKTGNDGHNYCQQSLLELSRLAKSEREKNTGVHYIKLRRGEQVVFKRNENRLGKQGIYNGELGTVLGVRGFKDGFGIVDIVVHKADGRQEKVALDLRELSKGPYFYEDISLDYGYAITSHTAQGADITHTINKFGAGYEVNNVNLTRHVESTEIIISREELEDAWYESLDKSAMEARDRFDIDSKESSEQEILRGGLVRLVSKRVNNSFAGSYKDVGRAAEDKILKSYIDKSNETIAAFRKVLSWQEQQLRKTGVKPKLWKNKELYMKFSKLRRERNNTALVIKSCYEDYKLRLVQMQMNYATIERHAKLADIRSSNKEDKVVYRQKNSILHEQALYKELIEAVAGGNNVHIRKVYAEVKMEIEGRGEQIATHLEEIAILEEEHASLAGEINREANYRKLLMPEYLGRIYSSSQGSSTKQEKAGVIASGGMEALAKYDALVKIHGEEEALATVASKPSVLGRLKGIGFGRVFALGNRRRDAIELCKGLERQLRGYNGANIRLKELEDRLARENYDIKISNKKAAIEGLRVLQPADIDSKFLSEVGNLLELGKKSGNLAEINWRPLQESELFETVRIHQMSKYEDELQALQEQGSEAVTFSELKILAGKQQHRYPRLHSGKELAKGDQMQAESAQAVRAELTVGSIIAKPSMVIEKLDHNKSVFIRSDIEAEIEKVLQSNISHIKRESCIEDKESLDNYIQTEKLKILDSVLLSPELTIVNACDLRGRTLFAKTSQIELEKRFISHIEELAARGDHIIDIKDDEIKPLGKGKDRRIIDYTTEQREVIRSTLAGGNISIIEGWPGAGKSTVAREIARHYQDRGYEVIAVAPTNKAMQELEDKLNCKSYTAASLRMKWQFERGYQTDITLKADYYKEESYQDISPVICDRTVLIMDEISMLDMPTFDYFAAEINRSGGKLIGLGDNNQNQAIGMKGAAGKAIEIADSYLLREINRHKNSDDKIRHSHIKATIALSEYQVPRALSIYNDLKAIKLYENEELKEQAIFSAYMEKLFSIVQDENIDVSEAASKIGMVAYTNAEIAGLNIMVRDSLKRAGYLPGKGNKFLSGGTGSKGSMVELCEGDRIIFKSNQRNEGGYGGVMNNEVATIRQIVRVDESGSGEFVADISRNGEVKTVSIKTGADERSIYFRHAYAITNHAVQGSSVDHILMSIDKYSGYEVMMVGLTRHTKTCRMFAALNTLENEVYRTKELDVQKVIEEYKAISYRWQKQENDEGKEYFEQEEVPLWVLGLHLLASRRSNLNFAIDYKYGNNQQLENENLSIGYDALSSLREDLNKHRSEIDKIELWGNGLAGSEDSQNNKGASKGAGLKRQYTQMELYALEHFQLNAGEVIFNARGVINAARQYSEEISCQDYVESLKVGSHVRSQRDKQNSPLRWKDLSVKDQNLVLHSYLNEKQKKQLATHVERAQRLEQQIIQVSAEYASVIYEVGDIAFLSHKDLEGNYGIVRSYLEARNSVGEKYQALKVAESVLASSKIQKLVVAEIKDRYGIKLRIPAIEGRLLKWAEGEFLKTKEKYDADQIKQDKNYKPIADIDEARVGYLSKLAKSSVDSLNKKNVALFVYDIFRKTKDVELSRSWNNVATAQSELDEVKELREKAALKVINGYHDRIDDETNQASISNLLTQLNLNYQTISKHTRVSDERHYFEKIGEGSISGNKHYGMLMQLIEKTGSIDLTEEAADFALKYHHELLVLSGIVTEKLVELKSQKGEIIVERNSELKLLQEQKLFRFTEFDNYIGQIYKTDRQEVIKNLDKLLENIADKNQLILAVSGSPEMLGELSERDKNLAILGDNLKKYVEGHKNMTAMQDRVDARYFQKKLENINLEIAKLKSQLASPKEAELLREMSRIESASTHQDKLDEQQFTSNINRLFREDKTLDLLLNWQSKSGLLSGSEFKDKKYVESQSQVKKATAKVVTVEELKAPIEGEEGDLQTQEVSKTKTTTKKQKSAKTANPYWQKKHQPKLTYSEVKAALDRGNIEKIFRQYAPMLNPEDKIERRGNELSCGSLNMNCSSDKAGSWYRHSSGDKGDIFQFVEKAIGVGRREALEIVASEVGLDANLGPTDKTVDPRDNYKKQLATHDNVKIVSALEPKNEWVANDTLSVDVPKFKPERHLGRQIANGNKVRLVHEYRNKNGELLGYTVRMEDNEGKKKVFPVAWCTNNASGKSTWKLQGFKDNGNKPIYGADRLSGDITKPVLIVEGEKTADKAQDLLPGHRVISWMGGAQGINKVDWGQLQNRVVTIWPDNDKPGIEAANKIQEHIDHCNGFTGMVSIVDTEKMKLPEKWDLADSLPVHLTSKDASGNSDKVRDTDVIADIITTTQKKYMSDKGQTSYFAKLEHKLDSHYIIIREEKGRDLEERIQLGGYSSSQIYKDTLAAIARNEGVDLSDQDNYAHNMNKLQDKYINLQAEHEREQNNKSKAGSSKRKKVENALIRDTSVLHKSLLNRNKLLAIHSNHIATTVRGRVGQLKQLSSTDIRHVASEVYKETTSKEWIEKLNEKNIGKLHELEQQRTETTIAKEISQHLRSILMHIGLMEKMGITVDKNFLLSELKSRSLEEKEEYADKMVGDAAKKHFAPHVKELNEERAKATDTTSLLKIMKKENQFFTELKRKHEVSICLTKDRELINNMHIATAFNKETPFRLFEKLANHVVEQKIVNQDEVNKNLKENSNMYQLQKWLKKECSKHYRDAIDSNLKHLNIHQELRIDKQVFKTHLSYLKYLKTTQHHEFMPHEHIDNHIKQYEREHQQQQEIQKDLHMAKEIGGPCM